MQKLCVMLSAVSVVAFVHAADELLFPQTLPSGDISSAEDWGRDDFSSFTATFDANATLTATQDVTFAGGLHLKNTSGSRRRVEFDMRNETTGAGPEPRTLTFGDAFRAMNVNSDLILRGGLWNLTSHQLMQNCDSYNHASNLVHITDGAVVTNVSRLGAGGYGGEGHLVIDGSSTVYAVTAQVDGYAGKRNTFDVLEGSKVFLSNASDTTHPIQTDTSGATGPYRLRISGPGSEMTANAGYVDVGTYGRDMLLLVDDYGKLTLGGCGITIGDEPGASNAVVRVADHGQVEIGSNDINVGSKGRNALLEVTGDGAFQAGGGAIYVGRSASASNAVIRVADGGVFRKGSSSIYLGHAGQWCRIEVLEDGTFDSSSTIYMGGYNTTMTSGTPNNSIVVSNGTFKGAYPRVGFGGTATNSIVKLIGRKTVYQVSSGTEDLQLFQRAPDCAFVIDGASWTNDLLAAGKVVCFSAGNYSTRCRLDIVNGGELVLPGNAFNVSTLSYATPSNTVFVGGGSLLRATSIQINSICNTMVVSNGTVEAVSGNVDVTTDYQYLGGRAYNTNNWLIVRGENPRVSATNGTINVYRDSHVVFDLPEAGYGPATPIVAKTVYFDATSHLDLTGAENYAKDRVAAVDKVLVSALDKLTISDAQIAAANATLPKGMRIKRSVDKKSLVFHAGGLGGSLILVR